MVPEADISRLGQNYVTPECNTFTIGGKIHYWTKSLPKILETSLKERLAILDMDIMQSVDLVIGGYHGQGKFRCVMKIILRDETGKNIDSYCIKIGHIDCDKDTYDVLKNSITGPLNEDIKLITAKQQIQILNDKSTNKKKIVLGTVEENDLEMYTIQKSLNIRILMCGDLAFFSAILGKVNMAGKWCIWCQLGPKEWRESNHNPGEKWTIAQMKQLRLQIESGGIVDNPANRKGVVEEPLIDAIPIDNIIFSLLHAEIGVGNKLLESFF